MNEPQPSAAETGNSTEPTAAPAADTPTSAPAKAKGGRRQTIMLVLLAGALCALAYDYLVARPGVEGAYETVGRLMEENLAATGADQLTSDDVQDALARAPNAVYPLNQWTVEAYRWPAGVPLKLTGFQPGESPGVTLRTHDYYALYRRDNDQLVFYTHFKYALDEGALTGPDQAIIAAEVEQERAAEANRESPFGGGRPTRPGAAAGEDTGEPEGRRSRRDRPPLDSEDPAAEKPDDASQASSANGNSSSGTPPR